MRNLLLAMTLGSALAAIASADELEGAAAYLGSVYPPNEPGASVMVTRGDQVLLRQGFGLANVEHGIAVEPSTVFRIGSLTKQITAAAILRLQDEGKLSVDDPLSKYLPDYPTQGHVITIDHLLTHTSGIMSYTNQHGYMGNPVRSALSLAELIDVFDELPMEFAPGAKWNYNNSGYVLLGAIIETVADQRYADYIAEHITGPIGLTHTQFGGRQLVPGRAAGYALDEHGELVNAGYISMGQAHAAGAYLSTTGDLARWQRALTMGEVISDAAFGQMTRPVALNDGSTFPYGYGLFVGTLRGRSMISHGGGIHGFSCYALWLPEAEIYVVVLTNGGRPFPTPETVARKLGAMALSDPYPAPKAVKLSRRDRNALAGPYESDSFPAVTIEVTGDALYLTEAGLPNLTLVPVSRDRLAIEQSLMELQVYWESGRVTQLQLLRAEGVPTAVLRPVAEVSR